MRFQNHYSTLRNTQTMFSSPFLTESGEEGLEKESEREMKGKMLGVEILPFKVLINLARRY